MKIMNKEIYENKIFSGIDHLDVSLLNKDFFAIYRDYCTEIINETDNSQTLVAAWINLACSYRLEGLQQEAEEALKEAKKIAPENMDVVEEEARIQQLNRDPDLDVPLQPLPILSHVDDKRARSPKTLN
ncbi:MAG: tetratricopeptide repeat protein [Legionella sp.]|nr:tetratricopeptide repeat protein [Legionella sp.]